jgi:hypothetical protein
MKFVPPLFIRLLFAAGLLSWGSAQAFTMADCSAFAPGSHPDGLAIGDVTFGLSGSTATAADDCWGVQAKNDNNSDSPAGLWADPTAGEWELLVKDENTGTGQSDSNGALWRNVLWTLDAARDPATGTSGRYVLSWEEQGASALPAVFDLMVVLKGGSAWAGYLFDDLAFDGDGSGSGLFRIGWCGENSPGGDDKGQKAKAKAKDDEEADDDKCTGNGFSHLTIYARTGDGLAPPAGDVPVPGTLALLAVGLLGLGRFGRARPAPARADSQRG